MEPTSRALPIVESETTVTKSFFDISTFKKSRNKDNI